jgi:hypothetical protein
MYARYTKSKAGWVTQYRFAERVCLFGRNNGFIPRLLERQTPSGQGEPYEWHIPLQKALGESRCPDSTLVIDLKPKQAKTNLSLYEIVDVWGYSAYGWTPILLHLRGLFVDADPATVNRNDFSVADSQRHEPIYEFLYLDGSVAYGKLIGRWNAPPASPTNAALLWPEALRYFCRCIRERSPDVFRESGR